MVCDSNVKIYKVTHVWLAQLDKNRTSKPVMASAVDSIPNGNTFFAETFKKPSSK